MIEVGQTVRYVPCFIKGEADSEDVKRAKRVTGKVIYVNYQHEYFTVECQCGGTMQRESFKFSQLEEGKDVQIARGKRYGS